MPIWEKSLAVCTVCWIALIVAENAQSSPTDKGIRPSARQSAPIDLTGEWVSIVNEDWRWRMLTPPKGDYPGIPLNAEGRRTADSWNSEEDGSCKAYGAGGLLRMPTRVRITWHSEETLKIESDSGQQTRIFNFSQPPSLNERSLQGRSLAEWERTPPSGDGWGFATSGTPTSGGSLKVTTTHLQPGWLRKNGVPYGEAARITEYFDRFQGPGNAEWFVVTTIVEDPQYLTEPYITSSHFRREDAASRWHPRACRD